MKEHPILFSGPMVRAILEGRKTQTRRVVKNPYTEGIHAADSKNVPNGRYCPYGQPGDRLWVRETWRVGAWDETAFIAVDYKADNHARKEWLDVEDLETWERLWEQSCEDAEKAGFSMDEENNYHWSPGESPCRWRPSIFMPRWASRITLEIISVRVERVQEINAEGAVAEGYPLGNPEWAETPNEQQIKIARLSRIGWYQTLWDSINGKSHPWDSNPWVWVVEFRPVAPTPTHLISERIPAEAIHG